MIDLQAIEERGKAATIGPWFYGGQRSTRGFKVAAGHQEQEVDEYVAKGMSEKNSIFIAHARADIPTLIAEVRRLKSICQELAYDEGDMERAPATEQESWPELERYRELAKVVREMIPTIMLHDTVRPGALVELAYRAEKLLKEVHDVQEG